LIVLLVFEARSRRIAEERDVNCYETLMTSTLLRGASTNGNEPCPAKVG
jgi:hypothetical protein